MKKVNILFLFSAKGFGGIAKNISLIVNNLDPESFSATVVLLSNPDDREVAQEFEKCSDDSRGKFEFLRMGEGKKFDLTILKEIERILKEKNIQVLSCHGYKADVLGFVLRYFMRVKLPLVSIAHGWSTRSLKIAFYTVLDRICLRFFNRLILVSEGQRKWLRGFGISPKKISVIHNGVESSLYSKALSHDIEGIQGASTLMRQRFGIEPGDTVVGYAGRLSSEKDISTSIRAVRFASKEIEKLAFLVVGDGEERSDLEELAADLGISARVIFAGYQSDMSDIYPLFDIYISSSLREGLPNSVLEAMASGVPCVLTRVPGHTEIVEHEENGLLVDSGDAAKLAESIIRVAKDKVLAEKMRRKARETIQEKFSIEHRIEKLSEVYRELSHV